MRVHADLFEGTLIRVLRVSQVRGLRPPGGPYPPGDATALLATLQRASFMSAFMSLHAFMVEQGGSPIARRDKMTR